MTEHEPISVELTQPPEQRPGREWQEGSPQINWDQICFVRAVERPEQLERCGNNLIAKTLLHVTKGEIPRTTIHWSLNHRVSAHLSGSWDETPITIISPGRALVDKNDKPTALSGFDTYWNKNIILPPGTVLVWRGPLPERLQVPTIRAVELPSTASPERAEEVVNGEIRKLGYSVLDGDMGTYMTNPGLDEALGLLVRKEGIKPGLHWLSTEEGFEKSTIELCSSAEELFDEREVADKERTMFSRAIGAVLSSLRDAEQNNEIIDPIPINVFLGSLHSVLRHHPQQVILDPSAVDDLVRLRTQQPEMWQALCAWSNEARTRKLLYDLELLQGAGNISEEEWEKWEEINYNKEYMLKLARRLPEKLHEPLKRYLGFTVLERLKDETDTEIKGTAIAVAVRHDDSDRQKVIYQIKHQE